MSDQHAARSEPAAILARNALPADDLTPATGVANSVWLTSTHVVRLNEGRFRDAFRHEADVLAALPPDIPHPAVIDVGLRDSAGEYIVLTRAPGVTLDRAWIDLNDAARHALASEVAEIMARLHALPIAPWMTNPWLEDAFAGIYADAYHAPPRLAPQLIGAATMRRPDAADLLHELGAFIDARLDCFALDHDVLVHADLHPRNMLVADGRISALIDWEGCRPAAADVELDTLLRALRSQRQFGGTVAADYTALIAWFREGYPALFVDPHLIERLEVYEALWHLVQIHHWELGATWTSDPVAALGDLLAGRFAGTLRVQLG